MYPKYPNDEKMYILHKQNACISYLHKATRTSEYLITRFLYNVAVGSIELTDHAGEKKGKRKEKRERGKKG